MPKEEAPNPRFTGYWIPVELTKMGLNLTEQVLLVIIYALQKPAPEYCTATNDQLSKEVGLAVTRLSQYISGLKKKGLIEEMKYDGRTRKLRVKKENWFKTSENEDTKE